MDMISVSRQPACRPLSHKLRAGYHYFLLRSQLPQPCQAQWCQMVTLQCSLAILV